jgi:hypothetical protein
MGYELCSSLSKININIGLALGKNDWYMVLPPLPEIIHMHLQPPSRAFRKPRKNNWQPRNKGGPYCGKARCIKVRIDPVNLSDRDLLP